MFDPTWRQEWLSSPSHRDGSLQGCVNQACLKKQHLGGIYRNWLTTALRTFIVRVWTVLKHTAVTHLVRCDAELPCKFSSHPRISCMCCCSFTPDRTARERALKQACSSFVSRHRGNERGELDVLSNYGKDKSQSESLVKVPLLQSCSQP